MINNFSRLMAMKATEDNVNYGNNVVNLNVINHERAIVDFETAQQFNPNDDNSKRFLGEIRQEPESERAEHQFDAKKYFDRGIAQGKRRNVDNAILNFSEAIRLNPNYAEAYYWIGFFYSTKGDYDSAIENYTSALKIQPDFTEALHCRGLLYTEKGSYDKAIHDFEAAVQLNSNDAEAYQYLGNAYAGKGDYDNAIKASSMAIKLAPNDVAARFTRGISYVKKEFFNRAIADFDEVIRLSPADGPFVAIASQCREKAMAKKDGNKNKNISYITSETEMAQYLNDRAFRLRLLMEMHGIQCDYSDIEDKKRGGKGWLALGLECRDNNGAPFYVSMRGHLSRLQGRDPRNIANYIEDDYHLQAKLLNNGDIIAYDSRTSDDTINEVIAICNSAAI